MPKRSMWRVAQFDTLRLRLIKIAARVVEMKTMIPALLAHVMPHAGYFALRSGTHTAPRHLKDGARAAPNFRTRPFNPQTLAAPNSGSKPRNGRGASARMRNPMKSGEHAADGRGIVKALH